MKFADSAVLAGAAVLIAALCSWKAYFPRQAAVTHDTYPDLSGERFELPRTDIAGRPLSKNLFHVVVSVSDCSSCSASVLDYQKLRNAASGAQLCWVAKAPEQLADARKRAGKRDLFFLDPHKKTFPPKLFAFTPQAVWLDGQGYVVKQRVGARMINEEVRR